MGVATNMTAEEYNVTTLNPETSGHIVITAKHKTDVTYDAVVVLNDYWTKLFAMYFRYVWENIEQRAKTTKPNFLLTYNRKPSTNVLEGIWRLQSKFGQENHTPGDARKASKTYAQGQENEN